MERHLNPRVAAQARIGTAGWSLSKIHQADFPAGSSHLQRYAQRFSAVEINSSFYRPHKPETYTKWAALVPDDFRFSVKAPREITHQRKLVHIIEPLEAFLAQIRCLGDRLGAMLIQFPPSFGWDSATVGYFFEALRHRHLGNVVCEPRHASWFLPQADRMFSAFQIARVAAYPAPVKKATTPGGWLNLSYRRLHGSPRMYYSSYAEHDIERVAGEMRADMDHARESWCIFDNTALGEATVNGLSLMERLHGK